MCLWQYLWVETMPVPAPPPRFAERARSSTRLLMALPVVLRGADSNGDPFEEKTRTVVINRTGAKVLLKHPVGLGDHVRLAIEHLRRESGATVVWLGEKKGEWQEVGMDLETTDDFWGVQFPDDSGSFRASAIAEAVEKKAAENKAEQQETTAAPGPGPIVESAPPELETNNEPPAAELALPETPVEITLEVEPPSPRPAVAPVSLKRESSAPRNTGYRQSMARFSIALRDLMHAAMEESLARAIEESDSRLKEDLDRVQMEFIEQVQEFLRQAVGSALEQLEERADEVVSRNEQRLEERFVELEARLGVRP